MPEQISWERAKEFAEVNGCRQVVLLAWDGKLTHVVTYGVSVHDSEQAAQGGNFVKRALGWPEQLCRDESPRVLALEARIRELEEVARG